MARHDKPKRSLFGRFLAVYIIAIIVLLAALFLNVRSILIKYENSQPANYVISLLQHAGKSDKSLGSYLQTNCFSETAGYFADVDEKSKEFYNTVVSAKLEAKKDLLNSEGTRMVYNVTADGSPFITVAMNETGSKKKLLGLLSISSYELEYACLRDPESKKTNLKLSENGLLDYSVVLPKDFTLTLDGSSAYDPGEDFEDAVIEDFTAISKYEAVPKGMRINLELPFEPVLKVFNNAGEEVSLNLFNGVYYAAADYAPAEDQEDILSKIGNPVEMYKLWIRFTRLADVPGYYHGLYTVKDNCKLMPGSEMETLANNWATQVDILFVSDFYGYRWDKAEMDNFIVYNDKFCSCDIHIDQSIDVHSVGTKTDSYNNRMYFIYNEDTSVAPVGWYWAGQLDRTGR